ncbi:hypothetical protein J1605_007590 [Eschrichtius robustus]|uniref:PH domain-containing protein n=1 Tax=Eschrichtius robustus TaxID=9764 RepID=A0AB34GZY7_ESCRO|nr:hypothetical protein J1605_007590 [Eschrichtius robustus]
MICRGTFQLFSLCFSRQLEIHSPDAKHTVILRSKDSATAQAWFSAIHSSVSDLLTRVITEVREQLGKTGIAGSREIRHLGWLAEKVSKDSRDSAGGGGTKIIINKNRR